MKAKIEKAYRWSGKTYLPSQEEQEIPDDLAQAIGILKQEEQKNEEEIQAEETPSPATKSRTKAV